MRSGLILMISAATIFGFAFQHTSKNQGSKSEVALTTVALRVKNMKQMVAFYTEAFGARFHQVDTNGLASQFGDVGGITVKLVPIREEADFENFPVHQLGFAVSNMDNVIALAIKYGGRQEGQVSQEKERIHGAVRDPDGNTIELYQEKKVP
jgi:catechol 2,3-dioxygenase-like lactoylglutathione lyase family enzyme